MKTHVYARIIATVLATAVATVAAPVPDVAAKPKKGKKKKKKKKPKTAEEIRAEEEAAKQAEIEKAALELFASGREKYDLGNFEGAVEDFEEAYALLKEPNLLYNIAQAYAEMAMFQEAIAALDRYQEQAPESEYAMLEERRAQWQAEIDESLSDPQPQPAPDSTSAVQTGESGGEESVDAGPKTRVYGVGPAILTAVAIAGLGAGLGLGLVSNQRKDEAFDLCVEEGGTRRCRSGFEDRANTNANLALGANIAFGVGGAAALATVIWVSVNASKRAKENKRTALQPHFDGRNAGLTLQRRF